MAKTKVGKIIDKAYNGLQSFAIAMQDISIIILYAEKRESTPEDFRLSADTSPNAAVQNINNNYGLINVVNTIEVINTYDLCNPLSLAITGILNNDVIGGYFNDAQEFVDELVSKFRTFNIAGGPLQIASTPVGGSLEFRTGEAKLTSTSRNKFTKGSYVTITQTNDPKISSFMRGNILEVNGNVYTINIESVSPPTPPYQRNKDGDIIRDSSNQPILATFSNFTIEGENPLASDVQEIGNNLIEVSNDLKGFDFQTVYSILDGIPTSIPGVAALKKAIRDINEEIEDLATRALGGTSSTADTAQTVGLVLAGGLTAEEAISKSRKLRDAYTKILPYTDLRFALQELIKKDVENINRTLRDAIPYEQLAWLVDKVAKISTFILRVVEFLLAIVITINNIIKTINIILKVVSVVLKVIKALIKALPLIPFIPTAVIQAPISFIENLEDGIENILEKLELLGEEFQLAEQGLSFLRYYLQLLVKETTELAAKLESCRNLDNTGLQDSLLEANRNSFFALKNLLNTMPNLDKYEAGQNGIAEVNKTGATTFVVIDGKGTIMPLADSVFGFDEFGNIIFYGDLTSLSTGVNFEDTLGQDFRSDLQYYTFNKFEAAKHGPLLEFADNVYLERQIVADPEDAFGNFQEVYLGYTLKIQEDKPIDPNKQNLLRRRGIALDTENNIIAATSLTFSNDLPGIINELKYKLRIRLNEGIIGINTSDKEPNSIGDSDAINLAEGLGSNPIALNNIKAQANNRAASNISSGKGGDTIEGKPINPNEPIETRIGGQPYTQDESMGGGNITGVSSVQDKGAAGKLIDTTSYIDSIIREQQENDPRIKAVSDALKTISTVDSVTLSDLLKSPNSQNLSDEEIFTKLKEQVISSFDPNPNKIEEVKNKTAQWYEGLRESTRLEWEQLTLNYRPPQRPAPPDYEDYFTQVEEQALPQWIRTLLRAGYTDNEIQIGIDDSNIRDKWQIKIGPQPNKIEVILRPAFRIKR